MKKRLLSSLLAAGAVSMFGACSDDTSYTPPAGPTPSNVCSYMTLTHSGWLLEVGNSYWIIGDDYAVTDVVDNPVGIFNGTSIVDAAGNVLVSNVNLSAQQRCEASSIPGVESSSSAGTVNPGSSATPISSAVNPGTSSSVGPVNPGSSSDVVPPQSSSAVNPGSSAVEPTSSAAESSSSKGPELDASGFPTLESYGPPSAEYTKNILSNGNKGWNSRYWDACKPHCAWISNGQEGKTDTTTQESYVKGMTTARNCNIHDVEVPTFT